MLRKNRPHTQTLRFIIIMDNTNYHIESLYLTQLGYHLYILVPCKSLVPCFIGYKKISYKFFVVVVVEILRS